MKEFSFSGLGTIWRITLDSLELKDDAKKAILYFVKEFEASFSRFLPNSETNSFKKSLAGKYKISKEFAFLLSEANSLRTLTKCVYDPAVGGLLEMAGYDDKYRMKPLSNIKEFILPKWTVDGDIISIDGPIAFDLGGIGKGYCIDQVSNILRSFDYKYFLVDAGGDMFATAKEGGAPWRVAIEYPGKPDLAAGVINLKNQGLAVSDSFRRRWGKWHHLLNPQLKRPIEAVVGVVAVADNAFKADCMTSALFFSNDTQYATIARFYNASYLVFNSDGKTNVSSNWKGELF